MSAAVANPAFVPIGKYFHIGTVQASYSLMVYILFAAVGPLLAVPIANRFGRRPVYLVGNLVAGVCNLIGGYSPSWTGVMVTRAIVGMFAGMSSAAREL
jgi:MFS family permease